MLIKVFIILACVVAMLLLVPLAGFIYQRMGRWWDRKRMLPPGRLVDIGDGRQLYLLQKGQGKTTVIFESGFAASSLNWIHIQRAVAGHAHTISYDRCGLGWSSATTSRRTPAHIVGELRSMLREAGIEPPFVLVGHSFGGLVMRRYALEYPEEVHGVVLIDPMRTEDWPPVNESERASLARAGRMTRHAVRFAQFGVARLAARSFLCRTAKISGWLARRGGDEGAHLMNRLSSEVGKLPQEIHGAIAAHWSEPGFYHGLIAHLDAVPETVMEMHDAPSIGDMPVVVLTPRSTSPLSDGAMRSIAINGVQIIAEHSTHWIHLDEPQLVIDTIVEMACLDRTTAAEKIDAALVDR